MMNEVDSQALAELFVALQRHRDHNLMSEALGEAFRDAAKCFPQQASAAEEIVRKEPSIVVGKPGWKDLVKERIEGGT